MIQSTVCIVIFVPSWFMRDCFVVRRHDPVNSVHCSLEELFCRERRPTQRHDERQRVTTKARTDTTNLLIRFRFVIFVPSWFMRDCFVVRQERKHDRRAAISNRHVAFVFVVPSWFILHSAVFSALYRSILRSAQCSLIRGG